MKSRMFEWKLSGRLVLLYLVMISVPTTPEPHMQSFYYDSAVVYGKWFDRGCFYDSSMGSTCSNQSHCIMDRNCCPSFINDNWSQLKQIYDSLNNTYGASPKQVELTSLQECRSYASGFGSNATHERSIHMNKFAVISKCQIHNSNMKSRCENSSSQQLTAADLLPVVELESGVIYKNGFCAECNSVVNYSIVVNSIVCFNETGEKRLSSLNVENGNNEGLGEDCFPLLNEKLVEETMRKNGGKETHKLTSCKDKELTSYPTSNDEMEQLQFLCNIYTTNKCNQYKNVFCAILHNDSNSCQTCERDKLLSSQANIPPYSLYVNDGVSILPRFIPHHTISSMCGNVDNFEEAFLSSDGKAVFCRVVTCPQGRSFDLHSHTCIDPRMSFELSLRVPQSDVKNLNFVKLICETEEWSVCREMKEMMMKKDEHKYFQIYFKESDVFVKYEKVGQSEEVFIKFYNVQPGSRNELRMKRVDYEDLRNRLFTVRHEGQMEVNITSASVSHLQYKKEIDASQEVKTTRFLWVNGHEDLWDYKKQFDETEVLTDCRFEMFNFHSDKTQNMASYSYELLSKLREKYEKKQFFPLVIDSKKLGVWMCPGFKPSDLAKCSDGKNQIHPVTYGTITGDICVEYENKSFIPNAGTANYEEGQKFCMDRKLYVTSVHDLEHNGWLFTTMLSLFNVNRFWIGANDQEEEGVWKNHDGTLLKYTNWNSGEPNNYGRNEHCAEIVSNEKWNDISCGVRRRVMCESMDTNCRGFSDNILSSMASESRCGNYSGKSYLFVKKEMSQEDASYHCHYQGMRMAEVMDADHNLWLSQTIATLDLTSTWWIGIHKRPDGNTFKNSDQTSLKFTNWQTGHPLLQSYAMCVGIDKSGKWNSKNCALKQKFICESDGTSCPSVAPAVTTLYNGDICGEFKNRGYLFHNEEMTYVAAKQFCNCLKMDLTTVHDLDHNIWLFRNSVASFSGNWWLGIRTAFGKHVNPDQSEVKFTNFLTSTNWPCVMMGTQNNAFWEGKDCPLKAKPICESDSPIACEG